MRLAAGGTMVASLAIVLNAVMFQTERHPEPLFRPVAKADISVPPLRQDVARAAFETRPLTGGKPAPATPPNAAPVPPLAPPVPKAGERAKAGETTEALNFEIQRELAKRGFFKGEPDGKAGPRMTEAIRDFQFAQRVPVDGRPSEALLKDVVATRTTMKDELLELVKRASDVETSPRTVKDIQRALNKAGYGPLAEDGQWGPTTRQALTRFEQDNRLPPRGEPRGSNLRILAQVTGVPIAQ
ncbi:MAG: peptidoglycan-binding protein [Methylobacterium sp.]|jgi:peptidoglycan hydrolase-like protein with peptidoglycan-binding domain|nr:peptidoglycan-binding protein [Methylobacterium sp.]